MRASTAWSSQDADGMAACYEETASLTINNGTPSTGRAELAATARSYMDAFPDLSVSVDQLLVAGDAVFWRGRSREPTPDPVERETAFASAE